MDAFCAGAAGRRKKRASHAKRQHCAAGGHSRFAAAGTKCCAGRSTAAVSYTHLGAVKSEFETFGEALAQAQKRIELAGADLEKLVGVRTRQIQRKLRTVTALPQGGEAEDA